MSKLLSLRTQLKAAKAEATIRARFATSAKRAQERAVKLLQGCLGVAADGAIGNNTLAAIAQFKNQSLIDLINGYCDSRQAFLASLPTFSTFGRGWTARVERLRSEAVNLAGQVRP